MCMDFVVRQQRAKGMVKEVFGRAELNSYIYTVSDSNSRSCPDDIILKRYRA